MLRPHLTRSLLILVHPGSLCGSANFNLGRKIASWIRDEVAEDLIAWKADLLVLDGFLSDEIPSYRRLDQALRAALEDTSGGQHRLRLKAEDPEHAAIAVNFLRRAGYPLETTISLTGAWFDENDEEGCVNATRAALARAGYSNVSVRDSAARIDPEHYGEAIEHEDDSATVVPGAGPTG